MAEAQGQCGPDPNSPFPIRGMESLCFIKNIVKRPNIVVGDYSYYDDPDNPGSFERNVLYHHDFLGDRLIIGKFCGIAPGVKFLMNGAYHSLRGFTAYPFGMFGDGWEAGTPDFEDIRFKGDTVVGNDVWIGTEALILPGTRIGDGAIVAARSVVTRDVAPYTVVGGNPAGPVRRRFPDEVVDLLLKIRWWDWDVQRITENIPILCGEDVGKLRELAAALPDS